MRHPSQTGARLYPGGRCACMSGKDALQGTRYETPNVQEALILVLLYENDSIGPFNLSCIFLVFNKICYGGLGLNI